MEIYRSSVFANQLKTLFKPNHEPFQNDLCDELEKTPPKMSEIMSEVDGFKIVGWVERTLHPPKQKTSGQNE